MTCTQLLPPSLPSSDYFNTFIIQVCQVPLTISLNYSRKGLSLLAFLLTVSKRQASTIVQ
jgi:hypothetical protein